MRQRPFVIAGERQGPPARVRAPQRGALFGSPGALPLRSQPRRGGKERAGSIEITSLTVDSSRTDIFIFVLHITYALSMALFNRYPARGQ
jgi:hypothetical protein